MRWNPEEDLELPIWHPAHFVHQQHLSVVAQLVERRLSLLDVEDFLVGLAQYTPNWADDMLRPIVEWKNRRNVIEKSLANKTKRTYSKFEQSLLTWTVDADTDLAAVVARALETREWLQRSVGPAVSVPVSPYLNVVWGLSDRDLEARRPGDGSSFYIPGIPHTQLLEVVYREPLETFFNQSTFVGYSYADRRPAASRNYAHGRMEAQFGEEFEQKRSEDSAPFIRVLTSDEDPADAVAEVYHEAQMELARATMVVAFYYAMEFGPGGPVSYEDRRRAAQRAESGKASSGMRDATIIDVAKFYFDLFGVL